MTDPTPSTANDWHLFIADDNREFSAFVAEIGVEIGWSVTECGNGRELVEQLSRSHTPALVLVDVLMPELDGIESIRMLANIKREMRIRFMTGGAYSNATAAERIGAGRGLSLGPTILKPISLSALRTELRQEMDAALLNGSEIDCAERR